MRYYADHSYMMDSNPTTNYLDRAVELAKTGGRLSSDKQWELADELATLSDTELQQVAVESGRNESTLHQYARAAQRWPTSNRISGVSFSAHRVALSWDDPVDLLITLKRKHGSPTVQQVRQAMGLEGHPGMTLIERGIAKLDRKVSADALAKVVRQLAEFAKDLDSGALPEAEPDLGSPEQVQEALDKNLESATKPLVEDGEIDNEQEEEAKPTERWTPPIRVNDIAGM